MHSFATHLTPAVEKVEPRKPGLTAHLRSVDLGRRPSF